MNQTRTAALGRPAIKLQGEEVGGGGGGRGREGAFNVFAVDQPLPFVLPWFSDTWLFGLRGRFLAHECIILET